MLVAAALIDAAVVCALAAVPLLHTAQVPLLYVLLALQFSAAAFYEPGECASCPLEWGAGGRAGCRTLPGWGAACRAVERCSDVP